MLDEILDEAQVAALLGCEATTIQEKARQGLLPAVKYGRSWRFPREALLKVLNEQALDNKPTRLEPVAVTITHQERRGRRRSPPNLP